MEDRIVHRLYSSLFVVVVAALAAPSLAFAQQGGSDLRIGAGMVLDFGGEADYDRPIRDDDLEATVGVRAHLDYDVARFLSIGGFARLSWWEGEDYLQDRNLLFELGPRVAGHYDWRDFRFYLAGMPGLVVSRIGDADDYGLDNPALGFTMSIAPGMEYWFNGDIAVYVEFLGWVGHYFEHDSDFGTQDRDINLNQVAFNFGVVFAP